MKNNPIPLLLIAGIVAMTVSALLISAKLCAATFGAICLVTAWTLLRAGR